MMPKKATPPPAAERGKFTLVEIDGHVAIARGDRYRHDRPVREYWYNVSPHRVTDDNRHLIGKSLTSESAVEWLDRGMWRRAEIGAWNEWPERVIEFEIARPRNGREYGWTWNPDRQYDSRSISNGTFKDGWVKDPFPRCPNCYASSYTNDDGKRVSYTNYHDPAFVYVEACDHCHPGGVCDGKGVCAP